MSHTLLQTSHLIIKGVITTSCLSQAYNLNTGEEVPKATERKHLVLDFTIQVNGKLSNFVSRFVLEKLEVRYSLENWNEWYIIVDILKSI